MIEMSEIQALSDQDLQERIVVEREALAKLRFNHTIAGLESPTAIRERKRDIARLLTAMNQRKNQQQ
jgi:large subunit ribosomal protein L29